MSKLDNNVINYLKLMSLEMVNNAGDNNYYDNFYGVSIIYNLYKNNLIFDINNSNYINRDRLIVSPSFLPSLYSTLNIMGFNISLDNLKEYKKYNTITKGELRSIVDGIDVPCDNRNILSVATGISIGKYYINELIRKELPKNNLINYDVFTLLNSCDLLIGSNLETLNYISKNKINNIRLIILNKSKNKDNVEKTLDMLEALGFEVNECDINNVEGALNDLKNCKTFSALLINVKEKKELVFNNDEIDKLKNKYKIQDAFNINEKIYLDLKKELSKRLDKKISKWYEDKNKITDSKVNSIFNFLETKELNLDINPDNIKINDNYDEELIKGNNKILNLLSTKSPFVVSLSNDFNHTKTEIKTKNYLFNDNIDTMNGVSLGLASLGFKVFVSLPIIYSNYTHNTLITALKNSLPITYIFTNDTFLDIYKSSCATYELNGLRLIPELFNFRPADINEIIGTYAIVSKLNKPCTITIGSERVPKLISTNPKYVVAGAYRVKRERGEASGVLIASGSEVVVALKLAEELLQYNIDLRVVSVPSKELFEHQSDRYKYTLLPYNLKTFVLEFSTTNLWRGFASGDKYVLGVDNYTSNGTKEELLNYYNLNIDSLKTRIIELMKEDK